MLKIPATTCFFPLCNRHEQRQHLFARFEIYAAERPLSWGNVGNRRKLHRIGSNIPVVCQSTRQTKNKNAKKKKRDSQGWSHSHAPSHSTSIVKVVKVVK
jgi:hypothetical protein